MACNLRCVMCHVSYIPAQKAPFLDPKLIDNLSALKGAGVVIASGFEPMIHPNFPEIIDRLTDFGCPLQMITNGTRADEESLRSLERANFSDITISFDGATKETYERIRRKADFHKTIDNIRAIKEAVGHDTFLAVNYTALRSNMEEMPQALDFWDREDFDLIGFISMVVRYDREELLAESLYPVRRRFFELLRQCATDVTTNNRRIAVSSAYFKTITSPSRGTIFSSNPLSRRRDPWRNDQLGQVPGMSVGCRSPWTFAKILHNGDVQLCYKFTVGNLQEQPFEEIWFGERAQQARETVKAEREHCATCDYFRFCLSGGTIDLEEKHNYVATDLIRDFVLAD